jgi:hypothetical protein
MVEVGARASNNAKEQSEGGALFQEKPLRELQEIFQALKLKLESFRQETKSKKALTYELMPQDERNLVLKSDAPELAKKKLFLSEILKLRVNLYGAYLEQIQVHRESSDMDKAVNLMNDYAETVAIPFMSPAKQLSLTDRLMNLFSQNRTPQPSDCTKKWRTEYKLWFGQLGSTYSKIDKNKRIDEFNQLKTTFDMLYTYSFSRDNNPESQTFVLVDPTLIKFQ